jgi:hypothetical protein
VVLNQVIVVDSRPRWMIREDGEYACFHCSYYKQCASRFGYECNRLGGSEIPKIRGDQGGKKGKSGNRKSKGRRI